MEAYSICIYILWTCLIFFSLCLKLYLFQVMYNGFTGRKITSQIVIGPTYYQRFKIHSCPRGSICILNWHPMDGRSWSGNGIIIIIIIDEPFKMKMSDTYKIDKGIMKPPWVSHPTSIIINWWPVLSHHLPTTTNPWLFLSRTQTSYNLYYKQSIRYL